MRVDSLTHQPSNQVISVKWEKRTRELYSCLIRHLNKLKHAKPSIDNAPPKVYPHLEMRLRKMKLEQGKCNLILDRIVDIKRKNQILLSRIAYQISKINEVGQARIKHRPLINERKIRDLAEIDRQNAELKKRIECKTSYYNRFEWLADRRKNLGFLQNISQYSQNYRKLVEEFDANEALVRAVKTATGVRSHTPKPTVALPALTKSA